MYSCDQEGTVLLQALLVAEHGEPLPVLMTACPEHVNAVAHWLEVHGDGDPIERWATSTFFEHAQLWEDSGIDWHVLQTA